MWTARRIGRIRIDRENARDRSLRFSLSARSAVARRHEAVHGARALQRPRKIACTQWMGARLGRRKRPPRATERLRHGDGAKGHQALREGGWPQQRCTCAPPFRLNGMAQRAATTTPTIVPTTHHNNTRGAVRGRITHHQIFLRPEVNFFFGERSSPQPRAKVGLETSSSRRTSSSWAALGQVKPHEEPNKPQVVHVPLAQWASLPRVLPIAP